MSAPWGVELDKNILVVVDDNILVVVGNDGGDRAFLGLRDRLGLDAGLNLAVEDILHELGDVLLDNLLVLVVGELGVCLGVLDGEGGPLGGVEVQVSTVGTERLCVNGGHVKGTLVLLGDGLQGLSEFGTFLRSLREDVGERNASLS